MRTPWLVALCSSSLLLLPSLAGAHARLTSPTPRNLVDGNKVGPCGVAKTGTPTVLLMGSQLKVDWIETIEHPGYYRLLWSKDNDVTFDVLKDNIPDQVKPAGMDLAYSTTITLPNEPCDNCTLQFIQYMSDSMSNYFSCADITLVATLPPDMGPAADLGGAAPDDLGGSDPADLGAGEAADGGAPGDDAAGVNPEDRPKAGLPGCSAAATAAAGSGGLVPFALFLAFTLGRRRRRR